MLAQIQEEYGNDVRVVFRHFPLIGTPEQPFHDKAGLAAQAAEAAGLQGRFWEMSELLFDRQGEWSLLPVDQFETWLAARAGELDLDEAKFSNDLTSDALRTKIQQAWDFGQQIGMPGTPFVMVNWQLWPNNVPKDHWGFNAVIQLTLLEKRQYDACPAMTIDPAKRYVATINTEKGEIVIELFADSAPLAVNSFIFLARNDWYKDITFHRVLPGYVAQAGDPTGTGFGSPGYAFDNEISPDLTFDRAGLVAMANAGPGSNGSQFFITFAPASQLDGTYTIFGQVIKGMDVAESLSARDPSQNVDLPAGDRIMNITIEEK